MKKIVFIALAVLIVVAFSGCDWFKSLLNIGDADLKVESVWVYEDSGIVSYVDISMQNYGTKEADDVRFILVFSTDTDIDQSDYTIYEEYISIESDDWYDTTIYWDTIAEYLDNMGTVIPVQEGYIGAIIDADDSISEEDGDWDNSLTDYTLTAVPTADSYEYDNDSGSATDLVNQGSATANTFYPSNDEDWFWFDADDTMFYDIITSAVGDVATDTYLEIYDTTLTLQAFDDDSAGNSFAGINSWDCPATGTYYIKVTEFSGGLGMYQVSLSEHF